MSKLTVKQEALLERVRDVGGKLPWVELFGPENAIATKLEKAGLCVRGAPGKNMFGCATRGDLYLTNAGRAALLE